MLKTGKADGEGEGFENNGNEGIGFNLIHFGGSVVSGFLNLSRIFKIGIGFGVFIVFLFGCIIFTSLSSRPVASQDVTVTDAAKAEGESDSQTEGSPTPVAGFVSIETATEIPSVTPQSGQPVNQALPVQQSEYGVYQAQNGVIVYSISPIPYYAPMPPETRPGCQLWYANQGDTYWGIYTRTGVSTDTLVADNGDMLYLNSYIHVCPR